MSGMPPWSDLDFLLTAPSSSATSQPPSTRARVLNCPLHPYAQRADSSCDLLRYYDSVLPGPPLHRLPHSSAFSDQLRNVLIRETQHHPVLVQHGISFPVQLIDRTSEHDLALCAWRARHRVKATYCLR